MKNAMTVGDLRRAIEGLDDSLPVLVVAEAFADGDLDTLHAVALVARFKTAGPGGFFSGPPVDHLSIFADGVPEGQCRECGTRDGKHHFSLCARKQDESDEYLG